MRVIFRDKIFWLLLIFASIYILGNIGTGSLSTWDEAIYANISSEILQNRIWTALFHRGNPWFDKPPLYMWLTAIFYKVFGINEFSTRLTSALFSIATIILMYIAGTRFVDKKIGFLSAIILLALPHYLHFAKLGMMDAPLTFFIVLMIYLFWIGQEKSQYLFLSGAILGMAYLMKGFASFLGPFIILVFVVFSGKWKILFKREFITGVLLSLSIILLWHLIQYYVAGPEAARDYFAFHIFERATQSVQYHTGGINFYQKAIFNKNKPWPILLYISVFYILWQAIKFKDKRAILICCWIGATYVLYTAVRTKLHWYIVPIYPALALSSAMFLERFFKNKAFKFALIIILIGMLIQVPISWAFKLDYTPEVKKVANYAKKLQPEEKNIYIIGMSYSEMFYCDFAQPLEKGLYNSIIARGEQEAYCIILPEYLEEASVKYNFGYQPIYESDRLSLYKIKFKR